MKALRLVLVLGVVMMIALPAVATDTVGVQDPATGHWTLRDENTNTKTFVYGNPGDVPFIGDWNCDGVETPGLYRQSDGFAYLREQQHHRDRRRQLLLRQPRRLAPGR